MAARTGVLPEELIESILTYACTHTSVRRDHGSEALHVHNGRVTDVLDHLDTGAAGRPNTVLFPAPAQERKPRTMRAVDVVMTRHVMQLNRHYYALGAQILYRAPVLATPSQLTQFARTLVARPVLGHLVRHLYVGTTEPRTELPLSLFQGGAASYERGLSLAPESTSAAAAAAHPCEPTGSILPHVVEQDLGEISALYMGPIGAHGFDIYRPGFDREDEWIGVGPWVLRLHETRCLLRWMRALAYQERLETAQTVTLDPPLETQLAALRAEAETARMAIGDLLNEYDTSDHRPLFERRTGTRHDPLDWESATMELAPLPEGLPLEEYEVVLALQWRIVDGWPEAWRAAMPRWLCALLALAIAYGRYLGMTATASRRTAILQDVHRSDPRLTDARRRGMAFFAARDRFDDPCLYARSGVMHFLVGEEFVVPGHAAGTQHGAFWTQPERSSDGELLAPTADQLVVGSFGPRPLDLLPHLLTVPSTRDTGAAPARGEYTPPPTLGSLLSTVHGVLSQTPGLQSLGLSGVLERAVAGERTTTQLPQLARVYLGPPPSYWAHPLLFGNAEHPTFQGVRHVAITGCLLFRDEAASLAGAHGALPHLETVSWSMYHSTWEENAHSILSAMVTMLDLPAAYPTPSATGRRGVPHLRVVLHPSDYEAVRANAPPGLLSSPRLVLEAAPQNYTGGRHAIFHDWERHARPSTIEEIGG